MYSTALTQKGEKGRQFPQVVATANVDPPIMTSAYDSTSDFKCGLETKNYSLRALLSYSPI